MWFIRIFALMKPQRPLKFISGSPLVHEGGVLQVPKNSLAAQKPSPQVNQWSI